jgi:hypothetical protein
LKDLADFAIGYVEPAAKLLDVSGPVRRVSGGGLRRFWWNHLSDDRAVACCYALINPLVDFLFDPPDRPLSKWYRLGESAFFHALIN